MATSTPTRREELLLDLEALVRAEGFAHLRTAVLARRLHCSKATLYAIAPSKSALMTLVFERIVNRAIDDAKAQADAMESPADKVTTFLRVITHWMASGSREYWRDVANSPEVSAVLDSRRARGYRIVQCYLDEGVAQGLFRPAHTAFVSYVSWAVARIARDPEQLEFIGISAEEAMSELGMLIIGGMGPEVRVVSA